MIEEENIDYLLQENSLLRSQMDKMLQAEDDAKARITEATRQAEDMKKASQLEYSLVLKSLINFNQKFSEVSKDKDKTAEIMGVLADFLRDIGKTSPQEIVDKLDEKLFKKVEELPKDEETEFEFDLEEAINPKKDLDLKTLCEELGVYRG